MTRKLSLSVGLTIYLVASVFSNCSDASAQSSQVNQPSNGPSILPGARLPGAPKLGNTSTSGSGAVLPGQSPAANSVGGANIGSGSGVVVNSGVSAPGTNAANSGPGVNSNLGSRGRLDAGRLNGAGLDAAQQGVKTGTAAFQNSATDSITHQDYMEAIHGPAPENAGIPFDDSSSGGSGSSGSGGSSGGSNGGSSGSSGSGSGNSSSAQGNPSGGSTGSGVFAPSEINPFGRTGARAVDRVQDAVSGGAFQNSGVNINSSEGVRLFSQPGGANADAGGGFKNGSPFAPGGKFSGSVRTPNQIQPAVNTFTRNSLPQINVKGAQGQTSSPAIGSGGGAAFRVPGVNSNAGGLGAAGGATAGIKIPIVQPLSGVRVNIPSFSGGGAGAKVPIGGTGGGGGSTPRTSPVGTFRAPNSSLQRPNVVLPIRK